MAFARLFAMLCRDAMHANVETCHPTDTVARCADIMLEEDVGFIPVIDAQGRPIGAVTDRDLVLRVLAAKRAAGTQVSHIMSKNVVSCRVDDSLQTAEELLARFQKSRIVVVDDGGRIAGVISLSDFSLVEPPARVGELLKAISRREALEPAAGV